MRKIALSRAVGFSARMAANSSAGSGRSGQPAQLLHIRSRTVSLSAAAVPRLFRPEQPFAVFVRGRFVIERFRLQQKLVFDVPERWGHLAFMTTPRAGVWIRLRQAESPSVGTNHSMASPSMIPHRLGRRTRPARDVRGTPTARPAMQPRATDSCTCGAGSSTNLRPGRFAATASRAQAQEWPGWHGPECDSAAPAAQARRRAPKRSPLAGRDRRGPLVGDRLRRPAAATGRSVRSPRSD